MKPAGRQAAGPPQEVRLIGGIWKRSRLPVASRPGLRPTPDRVRETLFNWLGQDLSGWHCLDAFAGSGALGLEAASRGAAKVLMLERDPVLVSSLTTTIQRLGASQVQVQTGDAMTWLRRQPAASYDLVLLDPPFDADLFEAALALAVPLLRPGGFLYLEADREQVPDAWAALELTLHRHLRAGAVHAHLARRVQPPMGDMTGMAAVAGLNSETRDVAGNGSAAANGPATREPDDLP